MQAKNPKKYGAVSFVLLFYLFSALPVFSQPIETLTQKALALNLQQDRYWHILLHYQPSIFGGVKSEIDDPEFFLAKDGYKNPTAELKATIAALFSHNSQEAVRRFYARYRWLKEQLDPQNTITPNIYYEEVEKIYPGAVSIIFPTYYMNNPASMFGHTLLTIGTENKNPRLSHAVNYAAKVTTTNEILFAFNGTFGFFKGYYTVTPYYKKIKEYAGIEQRDMWEYEMNLTPAETKKMIYHIAELNKIYANYYFFTKNCSYNLLYLLEAARPSAELVSRFKTTVMPISTIQVLKQQGFIKSAGFRPSRETTLQTKQKQISENKRQISMQLIFDDDPEQTLKQFPNQEDRRQILDLATDLIVFSAVKNKISKERYTKQLLRFLQLRSKLGKNQNEIVITPPTPPDLGHDSYTLTQAIGFAHKEQKLFARLRFRPAFKDLTDPDYIEGKGAQIDFGDLAFRYTPKDQKLQLDYFDVFDIFSLSPRSDIFKPISWKVKTGINRKINPEGQEAYIFQFIVGGGMAYNLLSENIIAYALAEQQSEVGHRLQKGYDIGLGGSGGFLLAPTQKTRLHAFSRYLHFFPSKNELFSSKIDGTVRIARNVHLNLQLEYEKGKIYEEISSLFSLNYFF